MKLRLLVAATLAALTLTAGIASAQDTSSAKGKLSYALGYQLGREAIESGESLDLNTMTKALQDGYAKKDPSVAIDDMRSAYEGMQKRQQAQAKAAFDKAKAENSAKSTSFLAQNKAKPGVKLLSNGIQYKILETGNGKKPTQASTVSLQVAGPFPWGQRPSPAKPAQDMPGTPVSKIEMAAMRNVLLQMPEGSKWEIALPADQAFGSDPRSPFPPDVAVVFEVRLVSVK